MPLRYDNFANPFKSKEIFRAIKLDLGLLIEKLTNFASVKFLNSKQFSSSPLATRRPS